MEIFQISRNTQQYACSLFRARVLNEMIKRRLGSINHSNVDIEVNNLQINNVNYSFRSNAVFGPLLMQLIAELVTDPGRPRLYVKTVREEWERRYPNLRIPAKCTIFKYMKKRMKLSFKDRKYEPDVRNAEKHKQHRRWLVKELIPRYESEDYEVIWFDEKGFQTLDSETQRW